MSEPILDSRIQATDKGAALTYNLFRIMLVNMN